MANIRFINRGNKRGEIWLYDEVGESFFGGGMSAKRFGEELNALGQVDTINLRINSPGGSVFDGLAIYNQLARHPARVEVDVDGIAASIASVIAMAGDEIRIAANAMMMIHDPAGVVVGGAADMRKTADLLDQVKGNLVDTYVKRTRNTVAEVESMMAAETWLTAADSVENGFADSVTEELQVAASFDLSRFRNTPRRYAKADGGRPLRDMAAVKFAAMSKRIAAHASQ